MSGANGAAAPAAPAAGASPAPSSTPTASAPPSQGSGTGTPLAHSPSNGSNGSNGGQPSSGAQQSSYHEWEETVDGKPQKYRASQDAMRTAYRREGAMNRKFAEFSEQERRFQAAAQQLEQRQRAFNEGRLGEFFDPSMPMDTKITMLGRELAQLLDTEKQMADPLQRDLIERARRGDHAQSELARRQQREEEWQHEQHVLAAKERLAEGYGRALKEFKLPANDITVGLMAALQKDAREEGWQMPPDVLARETHRATAEMFDSFAKSALNEQGEINDDTAIELLDLFPLLQKVLHRGLIARYDRSHGQQSPVVATPPKPTGERQPVDQPKSRVLNSLDEAKAYGVRGLRTI